MDDIQKRIRICKELRKFTAEKIAAIFSNEINLSEENFVKILKKYLDENTEIYPSGWYNPPPFGISALFGPEDTPDRLAYDNLRKEQFWPNKHNIFTQNSLGAVYASPLDREVAAIGDFGLTIYNGTNQKIMGHLVKSLKVLEETCEFAQLGMELKELHNHFQLLAKESNLTNARTLALVDTAGTNIGHTIPFSYEHPADNEEVIIKSQNFEAVRDLISKKRVHLNKEETFKIPENIIFTVEARMEDISDQTMPNTFFHFFVVYENGKKTIVSNFNPVFKALGMDKFISCKYD